MNGTWKTEGGGWAPLAGLGAAVVLAAAIGSQVAAPVARVVADGLVLGAGVAGLAAGVLAGAGTAVLVMRRRSRTGALERLAWRQARPSAAALPVSRQAPRALPAAQPRHVHFHLDAATVAGMMRDQTAAEPAALIDPKEVQR